MEGAGHPPPADGLADVPALLLPVEVYEGEGQRQVEGRHLVGAGAPLPRLKGHLEVVGMMMMLLLMWISGTIRSMYPAGRLCLNSSSSWAPNTAASSDWKALSTAGDHFY